MNHKMNDDTSYSIYKNNFLEEFINLSKEEQISEFKGILLDLADHTQNNGNETLFLKLHKALKNE